MIGMIYFLTFVFDYVFDNDMLTWVFAAISIIGFSAGIVSLIKYKKENKKNGNRESNT